MPAIAFYKHYSADPFFNMAFDEWLLGQAAGAPDTLFLRLYTWRVATITFGYNQRQETALDFSRLGDTPVIRRITGGRALLHDPSELTYALSMNVQGPLALRFGSSLSQTSTVIAEALREFLHRAGLAAEYVRRSAPQNSRPDFFHKAPCFASAARYELAEQGRKIIASAQRREADLLLQHGAIKLRGVALHPALPLPEETALAVPQPIDSASFETYATLFVQSCGDFLGLPLATVPLSQSDLIALKQRVSMVEKKACERRQIIKQNPHSNSL